MNAKQLFISEVKKLNLIFFDLFLDEESSCILGTIHLPDEEGNFIDSYNIRIEINSDYPNSLPLVYETEQRIPKNIEWHVFPDGHCCIVTPPEESIICRRGFTLEEFIIKLVLPYFHNQLFREVNGFFLNERSHGNKGIKEYFISRFGTKNITQISDWLLFIAKRKEPNRIANCFCGSKKKYRKCHRDLFRELTLLSTKELIYYSKLLEDFN